jgi:hypothetical protein
VCGIPVKDESFRASVDFPAPGDPSNKIFSIEFLRQNITWERGVDF